MRKKVVSFILSVSMAGSLVSANVGIVSADVAVPESVSEAYAETTDVAGLAAEEKRVGFDSAYAEVGVPLGVETAGLTGDLTYKWTVNYSIKGTEETYTPTKEDLEKFIRVTVKDSAGDSVSAEMFFSRLPVIYIDTENDAPIVDKENYVTSDFVIQGNKEYNTETTTLYSGKAGVRGRGNSTWGLPKKPYKVKLNKSTNLLGFGKNKHWVLLANYYDTSYLRNKLSYDLSGSMEMPYMQSILTDVVLNGKYVGNYQLCEQVKVAEGRVDVLNWEDEAADAAEKIAEREGLDGDTQDALEEAMAENLSWVTSDQVAFEGKNYKVSDYYQTAGIDGGYLLELDSAMDEVSTFRTRKNQPIMFKAPEFANTNNDMMNYVKTYIQAFEDAVYKGNRSAEYQGKMKHYSELFDMDSLVDYWLVQEIFFNEDAMKKSTYLYKDNNDLFKMGPIWDMDWSSGAYQSSARPYDQWQTLYFSGEAQVDQWYKALVQDPYFLKEVQNRYWELRDNKIQEMLNSMDTISENILESANASLAAWNQGSYSKPLNDLKSWMTSRIAFMDGKMKSYEKFTGDFLKGNKKLTVTYADGSDLGKDTISPKETAYDAMALEGRPLKAELTGLNGVVSAELWVNEVMAEKLKVSGSSVEFAVPALTEDSVVQVYTYGISGSVRGSYYLTIKAEEDDDVITGIQVTPPVKLEYTKGESLDLTGMVVEALYQDGTKSVITDGYTVSELKPEVGTQTITITYGQMTASFEVTVKETAAVLEGISIKKNPDKMRYVIGESLDLTGMVVEAVYSDGSKKEISDYTVSKLEEKTGKQKVIVNYEGKTAEFTVEVVEKSIPITEVSLNYTSKDMIIGENFTLKASCKPENTTEDKSVFWESSDPEILTVDQEGSLNALKPGRVVVKATIGSKSAECTVTVFGTEKIYDDIDPNAWYYDVVNWAYLSKLMTGYSDGSFGPADDLGRGQFATILYRMEKCPKTEYADIFPDVPDGQFYTEAVIWANKNNIITGYTNTETFGPADDITREQLATILYRYAAYKGQDVTKLADLSDFPDSGLVSEFAETAMRWAVGAGLIKGDNGNLSPQGPASRTQAATMIMRFYQQ